MKILVLLILIAGFACKNPKREKMDKLLTHDSLALQINKQVVETISADSGILIQISLEPSDTVWQTKNELIAIKEHIVGKNNKVVADPDASYPSGEKIEFKDDEGNSKVVWFSSEAGTDSYYTLYAYFLRKKNGYAKFHDRRQRTIKIFRRINEIFSSLEHGGTYFGHQYRRILGYAEYAINKYAEHWNYYDKSYDVTDQKKLFISLLKRVIADKIKNDNGNGMSPDDKSELQKSLFKIAADLDKLISDYFYLKSAQEFQYSNY